MAQNRWGNHIIRSAKFFENMPRQKRRGVDFQWDLVEPSDPFYEMKNKIKSISVLRDIYYSIKGAPPRLHAMNGLNLI